MGMYHKKGATEAQMRASTEIDCSGDESLTKQEFKDDADINKIMARCVKDGGVVNWQSRVAPVFADVSEIGDLRDTLARITDAQEAFMLLPARTRAMFDHDPVKMVEFIQSPANWDEAEKLGLIMRRKDAVPPKAEEAPEPPAPVK